MWLCPPFKVTTPPCRSQPQFLGSGPTSPPQQRGCRKAVKHSFPPHLYGLDRNSTCLHLNCILAAMSPPCLMPLAGHHLLLPLYNHLHASPLWGCNSWGRSQGISPLCCHLC